MVKTCLQLPNGDTTTFKPLLHEINGGCIPECGRNNKKEGVDCCNDNSYSLGFKKCISHNEINKLQTTDPNIVNANLINNMKEVSKTINNKYISSSVTKTRQNYPTDDSDAAAEAAEAAADANDNMYANIETLAGVYENLYNNINHANELSITRRNERGELEKKNRF